MCHWLHAPNNCIICKYRKKIPFFCYTLNIRLTFISLQRINLAVCRLFIFVILIVIYELFCKSVVVFMF